MKLVIPHRGFQLRSEPDRVIIDTKAGGSDDRLLDRREVARRILKSVRMVDTYRRLTGEARLQSERHHNRVLIKESELFRWMKYIGANPDIVQEELFDGSSNSFRPRKARGRRMARSRGILSRLAAAQNSPGFS